MVSLCCALRKTRLKAIKKPISLPSSRPLTKAGINEMIRMLV